jgi:F-type H+-transporting ATPase subunit b
MMEKFLFLATEGSGGFSLNLSLLGFIDSNFLNKAIVSIVLIVLGRKFLSGILTERRMAIETAIEDAKARQKLAESNLASAKRSLAQAQAEAEKIRENAISSAANVTAEIVAKTAADIDRMQQLAAADTSTEQDKAINEVRSRVVNLAMVRAEAQLKTLLTESAQTSLVDRSIALVGGKS